MKYTRLVIAYGWDNPLPQYTCRKCGRENPMVYYAPIPENGTCICYDCAVDNRWVDPSTGDLLPGVEL